MGLVAGGKQLLLPGAGGGAGFFFKSPDKIIEVLEACHIADLCKAVSRMLQVFLGKPDPLLEDIICRGVAEFFFELPEEISEQRGEVVFEKAKGLKAFWVYKGNT